ncbi:hypothetical protein [Tenacibaculum sp. M341]|uniref:hypothetical protein n=1 Tax=Tenacibaculum sp. M341 TaxID=2530339 RepID=UPI00104FB540|nr:hypothetical protein [Tenacibaculum sp. M341]TCI90609.1 hypothetical protein EYW44_12845 [Tenacibaculum sp. M341]
MKIEILEKANEWINNQEFDEEMVILKEGMIEHNYCYSLNWCKKSEINLNSENRTRWVGIGAILISKKGNDIEFKGSAPTIDWVKKFELKLRNLEEYWYVEIPFKNKWIDKFVEVFDSNINEIESKVLENKITLEERIETDNFLGETYKDLGFLYEGSDKEYVHNPSFINVVKKLNKFGIACKIEIKTKKATNTI